ncbi:kinase-like domain-containing protein [Phyllosticta citrichinensis]|uniref:non-specific serine/threonine protein kinase n=1 Tax=Phyllosticta citrichinensis TaxID=1130410 RepID=A0ABR1Y1A4_9PEZI
MNHLFVLYKPASKQLARPCSLFAFLHTHFPFSQQQEYSPSRDSIRRPPTSAHLRASSTMTSNSDRVASHEPVYRWEEFVENLEGYCSGGYYPTCLGEIFHGRYRVIHKLGYGSYSTVWLARDLEGHRNVALKIIVASESQASTEAQILRALNAGDKNHPGYSFICRLLDEFWIDGPNGSHRCLVLRATGCSVSDSQDGSNEFPIHVARSMSAQALLGLSYIHSCGFVHGDLHKGNLLFERPELEYWTEAEVVENLKEPEQLLVERRDGQPHGPEAPKYCVPIGMIGMRSDRLPESTRITISDFGQSFLATEDHDALQTPRKVAPPEHFFKGHLGPPADVWTLGLSIYEILSNRSLFETYFPDPDTIISEMVDTLGRPPQCWWDSWAKKNNFYAEDGSRIGEPPTPLLTRLKEREGEIGDEEQKSLEQLYRGRRSEQGEFLSGGMLEYEPSKRMTADEAVMSDWMMRWARPDFERCVAG